MFFEIDLSEIEDKIERCETVDEFKKEVIPLIKNEREEWIKKINEIIHNSGLTKTQFALACGVARGTVIKWCKGSIPKKKETFLSIGTVAKYDFMEMKEFLQKYGKCAGIFAENKDFNDFYFIITKFIKINCEEDKISVSKLANGQGWSSSLKQCVSAIKQKKWIPNRNKVISLALHLGMNRQEINDLLKQAYMEPLSPTNIFEATILYILESVEVNFINTDNKNYMNSFQLEYAADIMKQIDDPEVIAFLSELQNED